MKTQSILPMRIAKYGYIVVSVATCILGIMLAFIHTPSTLVLGRILGVILLVFGCVKLIGYYSKDLYRLAFQYDFQFGILLAILGVIILIKPEISVGFMCAAVGICMIFESLFKSKIAFEARNFGVKSWWLTLVASILNGIAGIMLVFAHTEAIKLISVFFGISLIIDGIMNLIVAISFVKIVKNQQPDIIEVDTYREI